MLVMMTSAVAKSDLASKFLGDLAVMTAQRNRIIKGPTRGETQDEDGDVIAAAFKEKAVYRFSERVFLVVHRAKVTSCVRTAWTCPAVADSTQVKFGSVTLILDASRQRMERFKVGILDIRCPMDECIVRALAEWIARDKLALITGWFG